MNQYWADCAISACLSLDVAHFCIAPGSRSTPLAIAVAKAVPLERVTVHFDERGLGFFAVGAARRTQKPVVCICTSGTALANFHPACIEAELEGVPLLIFSADRPPELLHCGANQAIDQKKIFSCAKEYFELGCPDENIDAHYVTSTIAHAVRQARLRPYGPVHINFSFREPLEPIPYTKALPKTPIQTYPHLCSDGKEALICVGKGIIAVGKLETKKEQHSVTKIAEALAWPVHADICSGLRGTLLRQFNANTATDFDADIVLHLGGRITSKKLGQWMAKRQPKLIVCSQSPHSHESFCPASFHSSASLESLAAIDWQYQPWEIPSHAVDMDFAWGELAAVFALRGLPATTRLFLSNSLPIRYFDNYMPRGFLPTDIGSNRGASGIDGQLATAIGYDADIAVLGDIGFLHDMNSLALIKNTAMTIIVFNNGGGAIFGQLPLAKKAPESILDQFFFTRHAFTFEKIAAMFGIPYCLAEGSHDLLRPGLVEVQSSIEKANTEIEAVRQCLVRS